MQIGVAAALWLAVAFVVVSFVDQSADEPLPGRFGDLQVYVGAVNRMLAGGDLYSYVAPNGGPFTYPPFAALAFIPLTFVDPVVLWLLWTQASLGAAAVIAIVVRRRSPMLQWGGPVPVPLVMLVFVLSSPVRSDLRMGQVSLFLACLIIVDLLVIDGRYRRAGGLLTGLTAAMKLTPLAFLPALWLGGRRRAAATAMAGFVACTGLAWLVLRDETIDYWAFRLPEMNRFGPIEKLGNQGINAILIRWELSGLWTFLLWAAIAGTVMCLALARSGRAWRRGDRLTAVVVLGCATIAASPVSWTHHQTWLVLAAALAVGRTWPTRIAWSTLVVLVVTTNVGAVDVELPPVDWVFDNLRGLLATLVAVALPCLPRREIARTPAS